jgi:hypothetical protein
MSNYVVAIPTYNRQDVVFKKTISTLLNGGVSKSHIYIFVANKEQEKLYEEALPKNSYHKIVVGKKGIANQRKFIANYFKEGQYVISMDDDVEEFQTLKGTKKTKTMKKGKIANDKLVKIKDVNQFFIDAYKTLKKEKLYIWGVYPVRNALFMYHNYTTDLRFIIGVTFGFIVRHDRKLEPSIRSESKEDYEQTILYYKKDGGVVRFNNVVPKTKFNSPGGLGTDRFERNKNAAEYLTETYPDIVKRNDRPNGTPEVKLTRLPRK